MSDDAYLLWKQFESEIKYKNRFVFESEMLKYVDSLCAKEENTEKVIAGKTYYRARIIKQDEFNNSEASATGFYGFKKDECLSPPNVLAKAGRANPRFISYLYLAEDEYTALTEVRPSTRQYVSISKVKAKEGLKLFCFKFIDNGGSSGEKLEQLMSHISSAFALPVNSEDEVDYIPTQYLAEYIKNKGFDGFKFNSSLSSGGINVTLFDLSKVEAIDSTVFQVQKVMYISDKILPVREERKLAPEVFEKEG